MSCQEGFKRVHCEESVPHELLCGKSDIIARPAKPQADSDSESNSEGNSYKNRAGILDLSRIRIVLVATSHPGNIGAAARAMKNMGLSSLYLVNPKDYPSGVALGRAASALDVLDNAKVVENLESAIADCGLVIGTSARSRSIPWPVVDPDECAEKLVTASNENEVALVFGREDRGLSNEELQLCQYHVQIPTNEEYSSLNVAAAVMVLSYEIRKASLKLSLVDSAGDSIKDSIEDSSGKSSADPVNEKFNESLESIWDQPMATVDDMERYLDHLEEVLVRLEFHDPDNPRQLMPRLRRLYTRIRPDKMEINILRGILTSTQYQLDKKPKNSGK
jgi:tRNA (cytidine32/uridine32-2'-O)-methyltransferase